MNAFESLVSTLLEREGYWVRSSFKVELTKDEKRRIGRPSSPRWELDLVAYKAGTNELRIVECKSYLDSRGVVAAGFAADGSVHAGRYKLFNDETLRRVVSARLVNQLVDCGAIAPNPTVTLCLAAAKVATERDRALLRERFDREGWVLWDDVWLGEALRTLSASGYDDQVASVVAKLLLRREVRRDS